MNLNKLRETIDYAEIYSPFAIGNKLLEKMKVSLYLPCRKETYLYGKTNGRDFKATINNVEGIELRLEIDRKNFKNLSALDYIFKSFNEKEQSENLRGYVQVSAEESFIKEFDHCVETKMVEVLSRQFEKVMEVKDTDRRTDSQDIEYYVWKNKTASKDKEYTIKVPRHLTECFFVEKNEAGEIKYMADEKNGIMRKELMTTFRNRVRKAYPEANEFTLEYLSDAQKSRIIGGAIKNAYTKTKKYQLEIAFDTAKKE